MSRMIVGVDGSPHAGHALAWAVARSERTGDAVDAVFAWNVFNQGFHEPGEKLQPDFGDAEARVLLDQMIADYDVPGPVNARAVHGSAPEALVGLATSDDLMVVGARGLGGFKGLLLGSVSAKVLELAPCPVVVIHSETPLGDDGAIVVGVDGSEGSDQAVAWAAAEARSSGDPVVLVSAWQAPLYPTMAVPQVLEALAEGTEEQLAQLAASEVLDGVEVSTEVVVGSAAHALVARDDAGMIVVGSRGRGVVAGVLLGSVSRQVVHHATAPVVVV